MLMRRLEPRRSATDIAAIIVEIQSRFDTASRFEERHPAIDIKAQRMRCEAAMYDFENATAIKAECIARGITLKQMFGCGERHLRKLRQLWRCWTEYEYLREAYAGQGYGIKLAFRLVGIPVDFGDGPNGHQGAGHADKDTKGEWRTPWWFFYPIHAAIGFTVDLAATKYTTLLARWFEELSAPAVGWRDRLAQRPIHPRSAAAVRREVCDGWRADRCCFTASGDERGVVPRVGDAARRATIPRQAFGLLHRFGQ